MPMSALPEVWRCRRDPVLAAGECTGRRLKSYAECDNGSEFSRGLRGTLAVLPRALPPGVADAASFCANVLTGHKSALALNISG